ncbi:hypothetical protein EYF80_066642 [Liparis tanakae]|uniref:Uncharacterized protein n=1 Tax=Liparis tanakae TaxID=230148 RepID=A0A4Z2E3D9_9TELE|nr:hypothetical protein EYF80_066642 [Liparis tanakae]
MDDSQRRRESGPSLNTADEAALVNAHGPETGVRERARAARFTPYSCFLFSDNIQGTLSECNTISSCWFRFHGARAGT